MSAYTYLYKVELADKYTKKIMKVLQETKNKEMREARIGSILLDLLNNFENTKVKPVVIERIFMKNNDETTPS